MFSVDSIHRTVNARYMPTFRVPFLLSGGARCAAGRVCTYECSIRIQSTMCVNQEAKYIESWPNTTSANWRRFDIPSCSAPTVHWGFLPVTSLTSRKIIIEQNIKRRWGPALYGYMYLASRCIYMYLLIHSLISKTIWCTHIHGLFMFTSQNSWTIRNDSWAKTVSARLPNMSKDIFNIQKQMLSHLD